MSEWYTVIFNTEVYDAVEKEFKKTAPLPEAMTDFCITKINETHASLTCGLLASVSIALNCFLISSMHIPIGFHPILLSLILHPSMAFGCMILKMMNLW